MGNVRISKTNEMASKSELSHLNPTSLLFENTINSASPVKEVEKSNDESTNKRLKETPKSNLETTDLLSSSIIEQTKMLTTDQKLNNLMKSVDNLRLEKFAFDLQQKRTPFH